MIRLVVMVLLLAGGICYGVWLHFGWPGGIGAAAGLVAMVVLIFRSGRPRGNPLQEMREQVAKRWTCKRCGTRAKPKSISCLGCGTNF